MKFSSRRLENVKPSASVVVSQTARQLRANGMDIIDLGIGEPDFDTPAHIITAAHNAALAGSTRYTPMAGTPALKQAICDKFKRDNDLDYQPEQVFVSNGVKQVIYSAMTATLDPGDEVLMCAPYFGPYRDTVLTIGATPKTISCGPESNFRLTATALKNAITDKTRWLMLNMPSNPAGAVYNKSELIELGEVLEQHPEILVLSDEIYEHIIFDGRQFVSTAKAIPAIHDRVLTVNGVSKAYAMTGWRIGYCAGPKALIDVMIKVQSQISSAPSAISQAAALEALTGDQSNIALFKAAFERRRDLVVEKINQIKGLEFKAPGGAFYAYVGCDALMGATTPNKEIIKTDTDLAAYLINEAGVATVPGSAYELSPFIRLSTATSDENLIRGLDRIEKAVSNLRYK